MGWYPCACCACIPKRVLIWWSNNSSGLTAANKQSLTDILTDTVSGVVYYAGDAVIRADDDNSWSGVLDDYALIIWAVPASDPSWWTQIAGNTWTGRLFLGGEASQIFEFDPSFSDSSTYINSKSGLTGLTLIFTSEDFPSEPGSLETDLLTKDVAGLRHTQTSLVSGGKVLARTTDSNSAWMAWNRPAGSRISYVLSGDLDFFATFAGEGVEKINFMRNLYHVLQPPCGTTPLIGPMNPQPIRFSFTTAALTGVAGASAIVPAATFTLSGNLTAGVEVQIQGASTVVFSQLGALLGAATLTGATSLTFSSSALVGGTGALAGTTALAFSTSANATGSGVLTGSTSLTFTTLVAVTASGMTSLTFTTSGQLLGAAPATGTTSLTFAPSGSLKGAGAMSGTCNFGFSNSGSLLGNIPASGNTSLTFAPSAFGQTAVPISGATTVIFANAGSLRGTAPLSGSLIVHIDEGQGASLPDLNGAGRLTGTTTLTASTSASLKGSGRAVGAASLTFANLGHVDLAGRLAGSTAFAFASAGALRGAAPLAGSILLEMFESQAALKGAGRLTGAATTTFTASAMGLAAGRLSGTSIVAFAPSGAMTAAGRLAGSVLVEIFESQATLKGSVQLFGTSTIAFTTGGLLASTGCLTPCDQCTNGTTPAAITLSLAGGCACAKCGSNVPDSYNMQFSGSIGAGALGCGTCSGFVGPVFVLTRQSSGCAANTCCWKYTGTICAKVYDLTLTVGNTYTSLIWSEGARVEALWDWTHAALPSCAGTNIASNLAFQTAGDGTGDCTWAGVAAPSIGSSGTCTIGNGPSCSACAGLAGNYVLVQDQTIPYCTYSYTGSSGCGTLLLQLTMGPTSINGSINIDNAPQAQISFPITAPYNCSLNRNLGALSDISIDRCDFTSAIVRIVGTSLC